MTQQYRWLERKNRPTLRIQKPQARRWVRPPRLRPREEFILHRRTWKAAPVGPSELERRAVQGIVGSVHERILYKELQRRKIPFSFQASVQDGRLQLGGMVADFILLDRPVVIRVQGTHWHTGLAMETKDERQRGILEAYGYYVLDIWDWEIEDPELLSDWLRRNIDVGMPSRGGGVIVTEEA